MSKLREAFSKYFHRDVIELIMQLLPPELILTMMFMAGDVCGHVIDSTIRGTVVTRWSFLRYHARCGHLRYLQLWYAKYGMDAKDISACDGAAGIHDNILEWRMRIMPNVTPSVCVINGQFMKHAIDPLPTVKMFDLMSQDFWPLCIVAAIKWGHIATAKYCVNETFGDDDPVALQEYLTYTGQVGVIDWIYYIDFDNPPQKCIKAAIDAVKTGSSPHSRIPRDNHAYDVENCVYNTPEGRIEAVNATVKMLQQRCPKMREWCNGYLVL